MLSFDQLNNQSHWRASLSVPSVVNALAILRFMAISPPQGVNAIARAVSLNPSSCFNLLRTLTDESLLEFDQVSKTYRSSPVPSWLQPRADLQSLREWLRRNLEEIALEFAVTCGVWRLAGNRIILNDVVDAPLETRVHLTVGQRLPSHIGAMGRCIAAHEKLSFEQVEQALTELRWQEPPSPDEYWRDMQAASRHGWALEDGRFIRGVTTVGAAIVGNRDRIEYCLSSTCFSGQLSPRRLRQLGKKVAALAVDARRRLPAG
jgi:DNA-binding IclR family transcriptional regulator